MKGEELSKRQSVEKREIIQNGIVSIPFGLACGGIFGAAMVAGATSLFSTIQEKKDEEFRKKQEAIYKNKLRRMSNEESKKVQKQAIQLTATINKFMSEAVKFPYDYYSINIDNGISPAYGPQKENILTATITIYNYATAEETRINSKILCKEDYIRMISNDYMKDEFESYNLFKKISGTSHYINYGYTINKGKNYILCW